jgi:hypothetical protein
MRNETVLVVINNDNNAAEIEFDITRAGFRNGASLIDRLGASRDATVRDGKLKVTLPQRSAAIFVGRKIL